MYIPERTYNGMTLAVCPSISPQDVRQSAFRFCIFSFDVFKNDLKVLVMGICRCHTYNNRSHIHINSTSDYCVRNRSI